MRLNHDSPDGMCVMAGCQFQSEKVASWLTNKGLVSAPLCFQHIGEAFNAAVPGHSRDTFTLWPLGAAPSTTGEAEE